MIELHRPWILALLPLLAVLALVVRIGAPRGLALGDAEAAEATPLGRRLGRWWGTGARFTTLTLLALVAAGPHSIESETGAASEGIAIVVALDVSESMRNQRLGSASRLTVALDELERFIADREGDVIGLVTFAGRARAMVPPVLDRAPLLAALERVRHEAAEDGTALGSAIGVAANRLRSIEARSRIIVAITDGESNAGALDPVTAAGAAGTLGLIVYTIGVGGQASRTLPLVAEAGHGRHFPVTDRAGLDAAYREIDALETSPFEQPPEPIEVPRHAGLLWFAALMLVTEGGVRASRHGRLP